MNLNDVNQFFKGALADCELKRIHIPSTFKLFGDNSLAGCSQLEYIRIDITNTLPTLDGADVFQDTNDCPIYVPAAWLQVFKTSEKWSDYADRYVALPASNEIRYTTTDGQPVNVDFIAKGYPSAWTISNTYENGQGVISFTSPSGSPASIDQIREGTFQEMTNLKTVILPDYVQVIGPFAFSCCYNLTSVQLGSRTLAIGDHAFEACTSLTDINLPEGLLYIDYEAFKSCESLEAVTLPNSVAGIGVKRSGNEVVDEHVFNPFSGCTSLEGFYGSGNGYYKISEDHRFLLSADGTFLFSGALGGFDGDRCQIPDGVETIGLSAFYNGKSAQIAFPFSLKEVREYAFFGYTITQSDPIFLPEEVNSIGKGAFQGLTFQHSGGFVRFEGDDLPVLGTAALGGEEDTYPIQITGTATGDEKLGRNDNPWFSYRFDKRVIPYQDHDEIWFHTTGNYITGLPSSLNFGLDDLPAYPVEDYNGFVFYTSQFGTSVPLIPFPEQGYNYVGIWKFDRPVQSIPTEAFLNRNDLDYLSIGNSVARIGDCAFNGCTSLKKFPILAPEMYLTSIGSGAFAQCSVMTAVNEQGILDLSNVTSLGPSAFQQSELLQAVILGPVPSLQICTFRGCTSLKNVWIRDAAGSANASNSITWIGHEVFMSCSNLVGVDSWTTSATLGQGKVNLPNVTEMYDQAFMGCSSIQSVTLGAVTSIPDAAFMDCIALQSVLMDTGPLTSVGQNAFYNCPELVSLGSQVGRLQVVIPNVTSIGMQAFAHVGMRTVIADNATNIGASAFANCPILADVSVPKATTLPTNCFLNDVKLANVNASKATLVQAQAFSGCTMLPTLNLPDVTIIGDNAFAYTRSLETLDLGENLEKFGKEVFFDDNTSLRSKDKLNIYLRGRKWYDNEGNPSSSYNWDIWEAFNYNLTESSADFQFKTMHVLSDISADFQQYVQYSFGTGDYILDL